MAKIDKQRYLDKIKERYGDKVELLSEYEGKGKKATICYHCEKHGDTVKEMVAKNVFNKNFCPCKKCTSLKRSESEAIGHTMSKEALYQRLVNYCASRGGIVIENEWIKAKTVYHFKCANPDHPVFESTADSLVSNSHWCPYCYGRKGDFTRKYENIVENHNGTIIKGYEKSIIPMRVRCNVHNVEWDILPSNLVKGRWCPICNLKVSEKAAWDWFLDHNIPCKVQYTFEDFVGKDGNLYRFDFGILNSAGELQYLLELDDESHRGSSNKYARVRENDGLKNAYCENHNITLYRIPIYYTRLKSKGEEWYRRDLAEKLADLPKVI